MSPHAPHRRLALSRAGGLVLPPVLAAALLAGTAAAGPSTALAADSGLGLPSLSTASRYVLAPTSRTVRPIGVAQAFGGNTDYVTAESSVSEVDAHGLRRDQSSDTAKVDGVMVRRAGPESPQAWFSYLMRAPHEGQVTLRVEEAGSPSAQYDVLVNGVVVYHRRADPGQAGQWGNLSGLVHYDVAVPQNLLNSATGFDLTFRNAENPGDGARVHAVWVLHGQPTSGDAPYGGTVTDPAGAYNGGATTLRSDIFGRPFAVYDFGRDVAGRVAFTAASKGTATVGLAFSESLQYATTASDYSQDPVGLATETHYLTVRDGTAGMTDPVIRGGFRYLMVFLTSPGEVGLSHLTVDFTADPTNTDLAGYRGAFLSSDDTLNRLWYAGAYTVQLATIDPHTGRPYPGQAGPVRNDATVGEGPSVIADGAKRDRMIWVGDNAVSNPVSYLTTGETDPAKSGVEFMAKGQAPSGQIPGLYLTDKYGYHMGWGEYAAWWVNNYWTHYLYTGDRSFLDRWYPAMRKNLAWFAGQVGGDDLLNVSAGGHWGYGLSGKTSYDNALYVLVLRQAVQVATAEGDKASADAYAVQADKVAAAVNATLWDTAADAYVVKPGESRHPQDGNAMAVVAGVATGERARSVLRFFADKMGTEHGDVTVDTAGGAVPRYVSPFVSYQELRAYASQADADDTARALDLIRRTWVPMLQGTDSGLMWENTSLAGRPQLGSYTSLAHGWSAGPTAYLTNEVLGVTPTSGGFATATVLPHPAPGLDWAQGRVPTPHGDLETAWKQADGHLALRVVAPDGVTVTAGVPAAGVHEVSLNGQVVWRDGQALRDGVVLRDGYVQVGNLTATTVLRTN
jgi:hypothetical protein